MADCKHLYEWEGGRFHCIRCGHERRGRSRMRKTRRKVGAAVGVMTALLIVILAYQGAFQTDMTQEIIGDVQKLASDATETIQDEISDRVTVNDTQITIDIPDLEDITESLPIRTASGFDGLLIEDYVFEYINEERKKASVNPLERVPAIDIIARDHSVDMGARGYFDHDTPEGLDPTDRGNLAEYPCFKDYGTYYTEGLAENIAQDYTYSSYVTAGVTTSYTWYGNESVVARNMVDSWMGSPGHRQNILNGQYDRAGIGIAITEDEEVYATQNFC